VTPYHLTAFLLDGAICAGLAITIAVLNTARFHYLRPLVGAFGLMSASHLGYVAISNIARADQFALSASFCSSALFVWAYVLMNQPRKSVNFGELRNVVGFAASIVALVLAVFGPLDLTALEWFDAFTSLAAAGLLAAGLLRLEIRNFAKGGVGASAALCGLWAGVQPLFPVMGADNALYLWSLSLLAVATGGAIIVSALTTLKADHA
jgi:hypothetical protein